MKVLLVLQEGPAAGQTHTLDPNKQQQFSVGRSAECNVVLSDHRASRHHADLRWNGRQWEVRDRGSTNGTYVNGMQVHQPYELRLGDRVTIGETTMVLRELVNRTGPEQRAAVARQVASTVERPFVADGPSPAGPAAAEAAEEPARPAVAVPFWIVQVLVTVSVICLASGALLPWIQITGTLSSELAPLVESVASLVASLSGQDSIFNVSQRIGGLQGYGRLTMAIAIVATIALVVDIFFYRKSVIPGVVYLLSGLVAGAAVGFDALNYLQYAEKLRDLTVLFGIQLVDVVEFISEYIEFNIEIMSGLYLTGAGLLLLLLGGIGRVVVAILQRGRRSE